MDEVVTPIEAVQKVLVFLLFECSDVIQRVGCFYISGRLVYTCSIKTKGETLCLKLAEPKDIRKEKRHLEEK
jgi:hypothetical protein